MLLVNCLSFTYGTVSLLCTNLQGLKINLVGNKFMKNETLRSGQKEILFTSDTNYYNCMSGHCWMGSHDLEFVSSFEDFYPRNLIYVIPFCVFLNKFLLNLIYFSFCNAVHSDTF